MYKISLPVKQIFLVVLIIFFLISCEKSSEKRIYEEIRIQPSQTVVQTPDSQALLQEMIARGQDPHAMLKKGDVFTDDAKQKLQEMIARGEDPHAFMKTAPHANPMPMTDEIAKTFIQNSPIDWSTPSEWIVKQGSGMRLVSFTTKENSSLDVSIVALGGQAGGLSANINRWLKQINLPEMSEADLQNFLAQQKKFTSAGGLEVTLLDFPSLQKNTQDKTPSMLAAIIGLNDQTVFVKMTGTLSEIERNRTIFASLCQSLKSRP